MHEGPRTLSKTTNANPDRTFVKNVFVFVVKNGEPEPLLAPFPTLLSCGIRKLLFHKSCPFPGDVYHHFYCWTTSYLDNITIHNNTLFYFQKKVRGKVTSLAVVH